MVFPRVIRAEQVAAYSPANHTGTSNRRFISRGTVGAERVEILIGTIVKGHGAHKHAHPTLEQASLLLSGRGMSEEGGVAEEVATGTWLFNPKNSFHRFEVTSGEPVEVLVIYAPPYSENPAAAVVFDPAVHPDIVAPRRQASAAEIAAVGLPQFDRVQCQERVGPASTGAMHLQVLDLRVAAGGGLPEQCHADIEQVLHVRAGEVTVTIDGCAARAASGDWVFIPEGATYAVAVTGGAAADALLVRAFG